MSDTTVHWHDLTATIPHAVAAGGTPQEIEAYEAAALEAACQAKHGMSRAAYAASLTPPPAPPEKE